jgi:hypothetical protein
LWYDIGGVGKMKSYLTAGDEKAFGEAFFTDVLDWVAGRIDPDEVFTKEYLVNWIQENWGAEDIFDCDVLHDWAISNGYQITE